MKWNVRKLISPRFQWKDITTNVLSLVDRFMADYNCLGWHVRKLISPQFQCTSITNPLFSLFDRFTAFFQLRKLKCLKTNISAISVQKYHKSCSQLHWPFWRIFQLYELKCQWNSYLREFSARVSQIVFLAYLTVLRLITTVWPEMSENS